jgi:CRP-like cAMP-binding protein
MTIAREYVFRFPSWFLIDFVATVPLDIIMNGGSAECIEGGGGSGSQGAGGVSKLGRLGKLFRLLRIFKLLRLLKLGRIFARVKNAMQLNPTIILLLKTLATMMMMLHLAACGYMGFVLNQEKHICPQKINAGTSILMPGDISEEGRLVTDGSTMGCTSRSYNINEDWIPPDHILLGTVGDQYGYAFFWAVSACTGIGWDIIPGNSYEVAYSSVMIITGMIGYIMILSSVSAIFSQLNLKNQKRIAKMDSIYAYLKSAHVTKNLKRDISAFYDFMWMDSLGSEDGSAFIKDLPKSLQVRLVSEIHLELLAKLSIFRDMTPAATYHLVNVWKKAIFMPTDVIIAEGTYSSTLYIIVRGRVKLTIQSGMLFRLFPLHFHHHFIISDLVLGFFRVTMMELEEGAFFGESGILSDNSVKQMASVRAMGYCELLTIDKDIYDDMRQLFPMSNMAHDDLKKAMTSRKARYAKSFNQLYFSVLMLGFSGQCGSRHL